MNIIYIGSKGALSVDPLVYLIKNNINIVAVAINKPIVNVHNLKQFNIIDSTNTTVETIALQHNIPIVNIHPFNADSELELSYFKPDLFVVSCFASLISDILLNLATHGGINIHPSLLPRYRGATPLFWQYQQGENNMGVTIHKMSQAFDEGDMVAQQKVGIENGVTIETATKTIANSASKLLLQTIRHYQNNTVKAYKQNKQQATYYPANTFEDFKISPNWTAQRINNFVCAYENSGVHFNCLINNKHYAIAKIVSIQAHSVASANNNEVFENGVDLYFSCADGFIHAKIA